ncbi:MAG TPA: TadE family protein [Terriglobales bacterium]|nr:TadE family protein [Terriglobales bacterium]
MSRQRSVTTTMAAVRNRLVKNSSGSEMLEFAFALPILLVMALVVSQFAGAFNLKQILNNAAREGARVAAGEFSDYGTLTSCSSGDCVAAVAETISSYLQQAKVPTACTFSTSASSSDTTNFVWTFTSTGGGTCSVAVLKVERAVSVGGSPKTNTRVTLTYPSPYTMGGLTKLLVASSTSELPNSLTSSAIMPNIH